MISSQAAAHERFGGVVPEVASRQHLELAEPVVGAALAEAGVGLEEIEAVAVTAGPGPDRRAAGRRSARRRRSPRRAGCRWSRSTTCRATSPPTSSSPSRLQPPFLCLVASGGHTLLAGVRDRARPRGARPDPRRRRGRGVRQGRPDARPRLSRAGPALERLAAGGDPEAFEIPVAMTRDPGLDFSFSGLKTALVYRCRELGPERRRGAPRRPRGELPGRRRRAAGGEARTGARARAIGPRSRSAAASPPTGRCAQAVGRPLRGAAACG